MNCINKETENEKLEQCENYDPITLDEIPKERLIRLRCGKNRTLQCFDALSLYQFMLTKINNDIFINPSSRIPIDENSTKQLLEMAVNQNYDNILEQKPQAKLLLKKVNDGFFKGIFINQKNIDIVRDGLIKFNKNQPKYIDLINQARNSREISNELINAFKLYINYINLNAYLSSDFLGMEEIAFNKGIIELNKLIVKQKSSLPPQRYKESELYKMKLSDIKELFLERGYGIYITKDIKLKKQYIDLFLRLQNQAQQSPRRVPSPPSTPSEPASPPRRVPSPPPRRSPSPPPRRSPSPPPRRVPSPPLTPPEPASPPRRVPSPPLTPPEPSPPPRRVPSPPLTPPRRSPSPPPRRLSSRQPPRKLLPAQQRPDSMNLRSDLYKMTLDELRNLDYKDVNVKNVDFSKMSVEQLRAFSKNRINLHGASRKADIIKEIRKYFQLE
jgi:hypothetical protein